MYQLSAIIQLLSTFIIFKLIYPQFKNIHNWYENTNYDALFCGKMSTICHKNVRKHCLHACRIFHVCLDPSKITMSDAIKAYRIKALLLHPEKVGPESTEAFQELNSSYPQIFTTEK